MSDYLEKISIGDRLDRQQEAEGIVSDCIAFRCATTAKLTHASLESKLC